MIQRVRRQNRIVETDQRLSDWIKETVGKVDISLEAPKEPSKKGKGVCLYLMDFTHKPLPRRGVHDRERIKTPLCIECRYLIAPWAETVQEVHILLSHLAFQALLTPGFEIEADPLPMNAWAVFGVPHRPSFIISTPVVHEFKSPDVPLVTERPRHHHSPLTRLHGRVYGPGDIPLSGLRVSIPQLRLSRITDVDGQFAFPNLPAGISINTLTVDSKRKIRPNKFELSKAERDEHGLLIRLIENQI